MVRAPDAARGQADRRVWLLGCPIDALSMDETVQRVDEIIRSGVPSQHVALNAWGLVDVQRDSRLLEIVRTSALVSADGQSVVWASRLMGHPLPERVAGPDLFLRLIDLACVRCYSVYLLGAAEDVVRATRVELEFRHPGLRIVGIHNGYYEESDSAAIVEEIRYSGAQMLFVAMPTPKKEYWLQDNLLLLGVPFCMGVGGTFDIVVGKIRRSPLWMQRSGLEWAYRLYQEPVRMWRRYLVGNARFVALVLRERLRRIS